MLPRHLALSGPMGSGKTTVGRRLAERFSAPFVDLDARIEATAGRSVTAIFESEGEAAFRDREARALGEVLAGPLSVISLGGGTVNSRALRRALSNQACLVTLRARIDTLVSRLDGPALSARPLLRGDPAERLRVLIASRADAYAEAHAVVDVDGRSVDDVADDVASVVARDPVLVALGRRSYTVDTAEGCVARLPLHEPSLVVSDTAIHPLVAARLPPMSAPLHLLAPGEARKDLENVATIWDAALTAGVDRRGCLAAIGGGVVGDLVGFAAATLLRGISFVQVPTTLLAMVDASVGGKTAIDRPHGKNLVGAFHQPSAVLADPELLATLPSRELRSGLSEVVKTALVGDAALLADVEANVDALLACDPLTVRRVVRACVQHKANVVAEDERDESGARAALNFGHTIGHALEAHHAYARWTHGEAVALGMVAALRIGTALGVTEPGLSERCGRLLGRLGLPIDLDREPLDEAMPRVMADKKREGDAIGYVLVQAAGRPLVRRLTPTDIAHLARNLEPGARAP